MNIMSNKRARSNMDSPNSIKEPCNLENLGVWIQKELLNVLNEEEKHVLTYIIGNFSKFIVWPEDTVLLWEGCVRVKSHKYPPEIKEYAKGLGVYLDGRPNGPAVASYLLSGGKRPSRFGSNNAWSIHHLYSGKFPYLERRETTHAAKEQKHFTQSAGLVAVHPIADAMCDEYPAFTWFLRATAYRKFGYDPDMVFTNYIDKFGFAAGFSTRVLY